MTATISASAAAAYDLLEALRAAETGRNEFGPYCRTGELVEGLRAFYEVMGAIDG